MKENKYQYKVVTSHYKNKKKQHYTVSTVTVDPEFEENLDKLMSCELIYSHPEYL